MFGLLPGAFAQSLRIAVAANAQHVVKALQADFKQKTGIQTEMIVGSSGKLSAQIKNGAPFDVFLSADTEFPNVLYKNGFSLSKPKVYALGSLIVCVANNIDPRNWQKMLADDKIGKVAIANPKLAPYGKAAEKVLQHYNLYDKVADKLVMGESIAQVNTYMATGVVNLGFTTEAFIYESKNNRKFKWMRVDNGTYDKIEQGMVILTHAKRGNYKQALKFFNYLQSPAAKRLFVKNGYRIP